MLHTWLAPDLLSEMFPPEICSWNELILLVHRLGWGEKNRLREREIEGERLRERDWVMGELLDRKIVYNRSSRSYVSWECEFFRFGEEIQFMARTWGNGLGKKWKGTHYGLFWKEVNKRGERGGGWKYRVRVYEYVKRSSSFPLHDFPWKEIAPLFHPSPKLQLFRFSPSIASFSFFHSIFDPERERVHSK